MFKKLFEKVPTECSENLHSKANNATLWLNASDLNTTQEQAKEVAISELVTSLRLLDIGEYPLGNFSIQVNNYGHTITECPLWDAI